MLYAPCYRSLCSLQHVSIIACTKEGNFLHIGLSELYYGNGWPRLLSAQNKAERNADEGGLVWIGVICSGAFSLLRHIC
jgi:hypothetical protein